MSGSRRALGNVPGLIKQAFSHVFVEHGNKAQRVLIELTAGAGAVHVQVQVENLANGVGRRGKGVISGLGLGFSKYEMSAPGG